MQSIDTVLGIMYKHDQIFDTKLLKPTGKRESARERRCKTYMFATAASNPSLPPYIPMTECARSSNCPAKPNPNTARKDALLHDHLSLLARNASVRGLQKMMPTW